MGSIGKRLHRKTDGRLRPMTSLPEKCPALAGRSSSSETAAGTINWRPECPRLRLRRGDPAAGKRSPWRSRRRRIRRRAGPVPVCQHSPEPLVVTARRSSVRYPVSAGLVCAPCRTRYDAVDLLQEFDRSRHAETRARIFRGGDYGIGRIRHPGWRIDHCTDGASRAGSDLYAGARSADAASIAVVSDRVRPDP